ncbi:unnamed protein product [Protopolystoma xenopodis]|uniref:Uncharacterized protein n=1 Tax=Protopolystoma xenopodis TaxID=117903 RepID=A0A3S4ZLT3_9PLAT|nr:unnamed protein product [Protopolystoma xenopodis]
MAKQEWFTRGTLVRPSESALAMSNLSHPDEQAIRLV